MFSDVHHSIKTRTKRVPQTLRQSSFSWCLSVSVSDWLVL